MIATDQRRSVGMELLVRALIFVVLSVLALIVTRLVYIDFCDLRDFKYAKNFEIRYLNRSPPLHKKCRLYRQRTSMIV